MESYYGPPIYDSHRTRKWLREAYREEIESYMTHNPSDRQEEGQEEGQEEEDEEEDLTDFLYQLTSNREAARQSLDWSDEDVLLAYMIQKQETDDLQEEEISDILQVIFPRHV